jgi:hypothetical protein
MRRLFVSKRDIETKKAGVCHHLPGICHHVFLTWVSMLDFETQGSETCREKPLSLVTKSKFVTSFGSKGPHFLKILVSMLDIGTRKS